MFASHKQSVSRSSKRSKRVASAGFAIEHLEDRRMYSASPAFVNATPFHASHRADVTATKTHSVPTSAVSRREVSTERAAIGRSTLGHGKDAAMSVGGSLAGAEPYVTVSGLRLADFSSYPLFGSSGPSMNDINQGQIGDCYFLSALAEEAAKDPGWIRQLVTSNGNGTFNTWFYHNGWVDERVDGYLPINSQGQLYYAGLGLGNSTWVAIMEKGFTYFRAAERGQTASYGAIDRGYCAEAFGDLGLNVAGDFGVSSFSSGTNLATYVYQELQQGYAIELATNSNPGPLVKSHAYAVVAVARDSVGTLYIEVRNPWGRLSANGQPYQWVMGNLLMGDLSDLVLANP